MSRITGYGPGFKGGRERSAEERKKGFRRFAAVGDRVEGILTGWESPGLGWVKIGGHDLLVELGPGAEPGARLVFLVKELHPDIVLKEIAPGDSETSNLIAGLNEFRRTRAGFERLSGEWSDWFAAGPEGGGVGLSARRAAFFDRLRSDARAGELFSAMVDQSKEFNRELARTGGGIFICAPWLLGRAGEQEIILKRTGSAGADEEPMQELALGFSLPAIGGCELKFIARGRVVRYRIFMERTREAEILYKLAQGLAWPRSGLDLECLGVGRLSRQRRGPLEEALFPPQARSGGFTARV